MTELFIKLSGTQEDTAWSEGDRVILTNDNGRGQMVSPGDDDKLTEVMVEAVDE